MRLVLPDGPQEYRFVWPRKGPMPEADRVVFVFKRPTRARLHQFVREVQEDVTYETTLPGESEPKMVTKTVRRTEKVDELMAEHLVRVENLETADGKPYELRDRRRDLIKFMETNMGLDSRQYGLLARDLTQWFETELSAGRTPAREGFFETLPADSSTAPS